MISAGLQLQTKTVNPNFQIQTWTVLKPLKVYFLIKLLISLFQLVLFWYQVFLYSWETQKNFSKQF